MAESLWHLGTNAREHFHYKNGIDVAVCKSEYESTESMHRKSGKIYMWHLIFVTYIRANWSHPVHAADRSNNFHGLARFVWLWPQTCRVMNQQTACIGVYTRYTCDTKPLLSTFKRIDCIMCLRQTRVIIKTYWRYCIDMPWYMAIFVELHSCTECWSIFGYI